VFMIDQNHTINETIEEISVWKRLES
jgi:hypothetical protein